MLMKISSKNLEWLKWLLFAIVSEQSVSGI